MEEVESECQLNDFLMHSLTVTADMLLTLPLLASPRGLIVSPFGSGKSDVEEKRSEPKRGVRSCFQLCFRAPRSEPVSRVTDEETDLARSDDQLQYVKPRTSFSHVDLVFSLFATRYFKAISHDYYFYVSGWAN